MGRRGGKKRKAGSASVAPTTTTATATDEAQPAARPAAAVAVTITDTSNRPPAAKKARDGGSGSGLTLSDDDEDRLGRLLSPEKWLQKVEVGKGAAGCVLLKPIPAGAHAGKARWFTEARSARNCTLYSWWAFAETSAPVEIQCTGASVLPLVGSFLAKPEPGMLLLLSGFGATVKEDAEQCDTTIGFEQGKVTAKLAHPPPSSSGEQWIEVIDGEIRATPKQTSDVHANTTVSAREPSLVPSSATSASWFKTPAPSAPQQNEEVLQRPPPRQPPAPTSNQAPVPPARPSPTTAVRRPTRSDLAMQEPVPRTINQEVYTPISLLQIGMLTNIIGVVEEITDPKATRTGDLQTKLLLKDPSTAKSANCRTLLANLFSGARDRANLPLCAKPNSLIILLGVRVVSFNGASAVTGYKPATVPGFTWICRPEKSSRAIVSPLLKRGVHPEEDSALDEMGEWWTSQNGDGSSLGVAAPGASRRPRPMLMLREIAPDIFFDTIVEVVKIYNPVQAPRPDIYVTDYSSNTHFPRINDACLDRHSRQELDEISAVEGHGHGIVLQVTLWEEQAPLAEGLHVGILIRLQNVRAKRQPNGFLCANVGGSKTADKDKALISRVRPEDTQAAPLIERRERWRESLEEAAFAIRIEEEAMFARIAEQEEVQGEPQVTQIKADPAYASIAQVVGQGDTGQQAQDASTDLEEEEALVLAMAQASAELKQGAAAPQPSRTDANPAEALATNIGESVRILPSNPPSTSPSSRHDDFVDPTLPPPGQGHGPLRCIQSPQESGAGDLRSSGSAVAEHSSGSKTVSDVEMDKRESFGRRDQEQGGPSNDLQAQAPLPPAPVTCHRQSWPLVSVERAAKMTIKEGCKAYVRVRARIAGARPASVDEWTNAKCNLCKKVLPGAHAFCASCAEEDGKDVSFRFNFAFLARDVGEEEDAAERGAQRRISIPIIVGANRDTTAFLPSLSAREVHTTASVRKRLRRKLEPVLGKSLARGLDGSRNADSPADGPRAFEMGLCVYDEVAKGKPTVRRYYMVHTSLDAYCVDDY